MSEQNGTPPADNGGNKPNQVDYAAELKKMTETLTSQITNLKGELNRKVGNIEQRFAPAPIEKEEPLEDLIYSNPKKVIEALRKEATQAAQGIVNESAQKAQAVNNLVYDYPELQNKDSDLFKAALKVYESMSAEDQNNPMAMKLAVKEAAVDVGIKPRHKRDTQDDFQMSGGGQGTSNNRRRQDPDVTDTTIILAQKMGLDTSNPKVLESLKSRSARKNWNRYE
jgi:hypothetical protein